MNEKKVSERQRGEVTKGSKTDMSRGRIFNRETVQEISRKKVNTIRSLKIWESRRGAANKKSELPNGTQKKTKRKINYHGKARRWGSSKNRAKCSWQKLISPVKSIG